jgi:hypothetical protein
MTLGTSDPNWHLGGLAGAAPSLSDSQNVLASLTVLEILGDYRAGPETVGLDNVTLVQVPEPACLARLALSGAGLCARRR